MLEAAKHKCKKQQGTISGGLAVSNCNCNNTSGPTRLKLFVVIKSEECHVEATEAAASAMCLEISRQISGMIQENKNKNSVEKQEVAVEESQHAETLTSLRLSASCCLFAS